MNIDRRRAAINLGVWALSLVLYPRPSLAQGAGLLPDIVEEISHIQIVNQQQQEILRFSTTHWNQGAGPLQIRGAGQIRPCPPELQDQGTDCTFSKQEVLDVFGNVVATYDAGVAVFHIEHNHWHMSDVAKFELHAGTVDGPIVAENTKVTFCLIDYDSDPAFVSGRSERVYFDCNGVFQGISVGWGDEYHHSTPLQNMNITGIPVGVYYLTHLANPAGNWQESRYTNNDSWVALRITRKGANPEVTVLGKAPCPVTDQLSPRYSAVIHRTSKESRGGSCSPNTAPALCSVWLP